MKFSLLTFFFQKKVSWCFRARVHRSNSETEVKLVLPIVWRDRGSTVPIPNTEVKQNRLLPRKYLSRWPWDRGTDSPAKVVFATIERSAVGPNLLHPFGLSLAEALARKVDALEGQLLLFSQQRLLLHRARQKRELQCLRSCEDIARELVVELEALRNMEHRGQLDRENRQALQALGAKVMEEASDKEQPVEDVVVNYHVARALYLRQELKESLPLERGQCPGKKPSERP